jgi:hypothetical protein
MTDQTQVIIQQQSETAAQSQTDQWPSFTAESLGDLGALSGLSGTSSLDLSSITLGSGSPNAMGGAIRGSNTIYTTTGTSAGSYSWNTIQPNTTFNGGTIELNGTDPDIKIGNKSLRDWMEQVEQRLNILTPNPELEREWDELRRLGERYRKLEKKCREKAEVWNKLKSMPKPEVKW